MPPYTGPDGEEAESPQYVIAEEEGVFEFQVEVMDSHGEQTSCATELTVLPVEPPQPEDLPPLSCEAFATPSTITQGQSTNITWSITGGQSPYLAYFNSQGFPVAQPYTITPTENDTYSIYVKDNLGSVDECYVGVTVTQEQEPIDTEFEEEVDEELVDQDPIITDNTDNDDSLIIFPEGVIEPDPLPGPQQPDLPPQPQPETITFRTVDLANFLSRPETKIGVVAALAVGIISALAGMFASPLAGSELILLPARLWNLFLTALGLRKKDRKWGTVYDAKTKQPLDPVHVVLTNTQTGETQTAITDMDGRYSFLVDTPGTYRITANKAQYAFPSALLAGKEEDHLYKNLYHGQPFQVTEGGQVITKNIPLDPQAANWNEQDKLSNNRLKFYKKTDYLLTKLADMLFYAGFVVAILALIFFPAPFNIATFALYVVFAFVKKVGYGGRPTGSVTDQEGNPIPHAILRLISPTLNQEIKHTVADKYGRYHLLANNGVYNLKVEHPETANQAGRDLHVPEREKMFTAKITKGYYKEDVEI
jgi:hypothetical protein